MTARQRYEAASATAECYGNGMDGCPFIQSDGGELEWAWIRVCDSTENGHVAYASALLDGLSVSQVPDDEYVTAADAVHGSGKP